MKSNALGDLFEKSLMAVLDSRRCTYWRLHTIRSFRGVSNPCDFIVMDEKFTALVECKATNNTSFSCAAFRQLPHFEKSVRYPHVAHFGILVYFHSGVPVYVYASDEKVLENKEKRRPINVKNGDSYNLISKDLGYIVACLDTL